MHCQFPEWFLPAADGLSSGCRFARREAGQGSTNIDAAMATHVIRPVTGAASAPGIWREPNHLEHA
ncbi:MAG TPA: hypothetical protein PLM33_12445 [Acidobacteriota bacterium]|nr:hypothetical protein [Acidobacteriota bacterium]